MNQEKFDSHGKPEDKSYFERELPPFLEESLTKMKKTWEILDGGGSSTQWDLDWDELNSSINVAEVEGIISSENARYLRRKYLRMED